jgi:hypothetical protein
VRIRSGPPQAEGLPHFGRQSLRLGLGELLGPNPAIHLAFGVATLPDRLPPWVRVSLNGKLLRPGSAVIGLRLLYFYLTRQARRLIHHPRNQVRLRIEVQLHRAIALFPQYAVVLDGLDLGLSRRARRAAGRSRRPSGCFAARSVFGNGFVWQAGTRTPCAKCPFVGMALFGSRGQQALKHGEH